MTVRKAVLTDAGAIASVHVRSWQSAYRGQIPDSVLDGLSVEARTSLWESVIPRGGVWVGLVDGAVVGFASAGPSRDADTAYELYAIYALESAWGTGLGSSLATAALEGQSDVVVWVLDTNSRAISFYERLGFRPDGGVRTETMGLATLNEIRYRTTG